MVASPLPEFYPVHEHQKIEKRRLIAVATIIKISFFIMSLYYIKITHTGLLPILQKDFQNCITTVYIFQIWRGIRRIY